MFIPRRTLDANVVGQAAQILRGETDAAEGRTRKKVRPFITISREFGCQGGQLASHLVEILNEQSRPREGEEWVWYDKQLLDKIAEDEQVAKEIVIGAEKGARGGINQYLSKMLSDTPDDYDVYQFAVSAISALVQRGNVVIVGRGGAVVTHGLDVGVHVRLYADMDFKLCHVRETAPDLPGDRDELGEIIERENRRRESFVEKFTLHSSRDQLMYDLMINNGRVSVNAMGGLVLLLLRTRGLIG